MKNIQKLQVRIALLLLGFFFLNTNIQAQVDYDKYRGKRMDRRVIEKMTDKELINAMKKVLVEEIKRPDYVAAIKVHHEKEDSMRCFYAENGQIFTAMRITLLQDFKGNFRSKNGEAVVIKRGGFIGDDKQGIGMHTDGFLRYGPTASDQILLQGYDLPMENNSPFKDLPAYFVGDVPIDYYFFPKRTYRDLTEKGVVLFETKESFDDFVYKTLGRKNPRKKRCWISRIFRS